MNRQLELMLILGCDQNAARRIIRTIEEEARGDTRPFHFLYDLILIDLSAGHDLAHAIKRHHPRTGWLVRLRDAFKRK